MRLKAQKLAGLIILFLFLAMIPPVSGNGWPEEQTRHIQAPPPGLGKDTDMFVTEAGIGHHGPLVTVLDPNMDIYGYLFFRDIKLNSYFYLENATLRLRTASSLDFDSDSSFTIYGINDYIYFGMGEWGYGSPGEIMSAPLTSAHVNYNSSEFYGSRWWEIDVTNIVQELKSNPWYEGPGLDFNDPGDYMAFIILGAEGHDSRWFYDLSAGNGFEAQLHIHWDFSPPPPDGYEEYEVEYIEDYGNFTIWQRITGFGYPLDPMEYVWSNGTDPYTVAYDDLIGTGPFKVNSTTYNFPTALPTQRSLVRMSNGTLFHVFVDILNTFRQIYIMQSDDNGTTWTDATRLSSDTGMEGYGHIAPSLAVDSWDGLHMVWSLQDPAPAGIHKIFYTSYNESWSTPIVISTAPCTSFQGDPAIAIDSNDYIHVVWRGRTTTYNKDQILYVNYTDSWSTPFRVSTYPGMDNQYQSFGTIAIDSEDHLHVSWLGNADGFTIGKQDWHVERTIGWGSIDRISTIAGMESKGGDAPSIAVDSDDVPHIVFASRTNANPTHSSIFYTNYSVSWSDPLRISAGSGTDNYHQSYTNIAIDSNDTTHVLWEGNNATYPAPYKIWMVNDMGGWSLPTCIVTTDQNRYPSLRWARWPVGEAGNFLVVDANGTVVQEDLETVEDAEDWIDTEDPDPEDPDPGGVWSEGPGGATGPFTRFKMRLYFLILGFGCVFGPVLFFSWRRPSAYYLMVGAIIMIMGLGLLLTIGDI